MGAGENAAERASMLSANAATSFIPKCPKTLMDFDELLCHCSIGATVAAGDEPSRGCVLLPDFKILRR